MNHLRHMLLCCLAGLLLLAASGLPPGALAVSAENIPAGDLTYVTLDAQPRRFTFTPAVNALYTIDLFPQTQNATARAALVLNGETIAEGTGGVGAIVTRLTVHTEYTLELTGSGEFCFEIARSTLSRCFGSPLEIDKSYSKLITREGDVHWYALTGSEAAARILAAVPENPNLALRTWLFDESGRVLARSEMLESGAAILSAAIGAGETRYLRVSAVGDATGKYQLHQLSDAVQQAPESIRLSESTLALSGHTKYDLSAQTQPGSAAQMVFLDSSDPEIVRVRSDGTLETTGSGSAVITAYAYGGVRAECRITVEHIPATGVEISPDAIEMQTGEKISLQVSLIPQNASERKLTFVTENERVATVDSRGCVTAVGEGSAMVVAITGDGSHTDVAFITVKAAPRAYRALLIGEQNYASTVDAVRPGSINSVQSIESLLATSTINGATYETTTLMDAPRDEVIAGIRSVFADAREDDVSLIYITCHGFYRAGMTFFVMADGSVLSARDLERELRGIPGEIILMADCCSSGGLLGEAGTTDQILDGITSVFQGTVGGPAVYGSKYRVIASALLDQDSYRISFSDNGEDGMATVFARALCDGAGWSIDRAAQASMNADTDYNGDITFAELGAYMERRVRWYLSLAGGYVQNVRIWPEGDSFVLFSRNTGE